MDGCSAKGLGRLSGCIRTGTDHQAFRIAGGARRGVRKNGIIVISSCTCHSGIFPALCRKPLAIKHGSMSSCAAVVRHSSFNIRLRVSDLVLFHLDCVIRK